MTASQIERHIRGLLARVMEGDADAAATLHIAVGAAFMFGQERKKRGTDRVSNAACRAAEYLPCGIERGLPVGDRA